MTDHPLVPASYTHSRLVPKDPIRNLEFRYQIAWLCERDPEARACLLQMAGEDLLFFVNAFCWTLDPRKLSENASSIGARLPLITWDYQDEALIGMEESLLSSEDLLVEKSRDMGASWLTCVWFVWRWLFRDHQSFLLVSRKADLVEGDDDSLMAHIDFVLEGLPRWMLAPDDYTDVDMQLKNLKTCSVIEGEATVKNVGRGGRRTAILLDEFAAFEDGGFAALSATADTTNCRVFNSTPKGTANAFYSQREKGTKRIRMHWSRHPEKRRGLYRPIGNGQFEKLDPSFDYSGIVLVDEVPRGTEGFRSPWYDRECARRAHAWEIAQELDIDYQGSAYPFFDPRMLDKLRVEFCREPFHTGRIEKKGEEGSYRYEFVEDPAGLAKRGPLKLWVRLDANSRAPGRRDYLVGCDIGQGTGSSDSVASVADRYSGEKIAELAGNKWGVNTFAELVYNLCMFFSPGSQAYLIWEATGPGRTFGKVIVEDLKYPRFYRHTEELKLGAAPTQKYGWFSGLEGKRDLLQTYREMLSTRAFLNPSAEAIREAGFYVFEGNKIEYRGPSSSSDPSNQGVNHGDRVIADALCAKLLFDGKSGKPAAQKTTEEPPILSPAWRQKYWQTKPDDESRVLVDSEW